MKLEGADIKNLVGNVVERMACRDEGTGFAPAVGGVAGPAIGTAPKPQV